MKDGLEIIAKQLYLAIQRTIHSSVLPSTIEGIEVRKALVSAMEEYEKLYSDEIFEWNDDRW